MVYDDVVNPAKVGTTNAKNGGGVVYTPGVNVDQLIDAGKLRPLAIDENRLTNRFDDPKYYGALPVSGGTPGTQTFLSTDTWTAPVGITSVVVETWGAGGGGKTGPGGFPPHGPGGGGGAYAKATITVVPGNVYDVVIGAGAHDTDGENTRFSFGVTNHVLAAGGKAGTSLGGAGGLASNSTGTTKFSGGAGIAHVALGGAGGSSAGTASDGVYGEESLPGVPPTGAGRGGDGGEGSPGTAGQVPGGGGGGGSSGQVGGDGANGKAILTW